LTLRVVVGLGANLGDRMATMRAAAAFGNVLISRPIARACAMPRSVRGESKRP